MVDDDVREGGFHSYLDDSVRSRPAPDEGDWEVIRTRSSKSRAGQASRVEQARAKSMRIPLQQSEV